MKTGISAHFLPISSVPSTGPGTSQTLLSSPERVTEGSPGEQGPWMTGTVKLIWLTAGDSWSQQQLDSEAWGSGTNSSSRETRASFGSSLVSNWLICGIIQAPGIILGTLCMGTHHTQCSGAGTIATYFTDEDRDTQSDGDTVSQLRSGKVRMTTLESI